MTLPDASREPIVLAYYYIWFTRGWFDGSHTPQYKATMADIHPAIGPYDSHDPDVISEHMKQCVKAKLDALAVSWYHQKRNLTGATSDDILESVMTAASDHGLRTCIDMEAAGLSADRLYDALKHYLSRYSNDPRVLHAQGKPVVLCWATWKLGADVWAQITTRLREQGMDAFYVASNQMDPSYFSFLDALECYTPLSPAQTVMEQYTGARAAVDAYNDTPAGRTKPGRWHATVMPGFEDRLMTDRLKRDDYAHFRMRRSGYYYWETFAAAMASRPEWLHVTSFNELAEHSHIEETVEDGDLYLRLTAEFATHFKAARSTWK
ncbi:MAG TPA: hypothetical protein PLE60_11325 [Candidatus Latescibacteria bacterium]|mgnify:FL=1|nr:hypothetical protein [Candidatus Latescibacterota bacterium]